MMSCLTRYPAYNPKVLLNLLFVNTPSQIRFYYSEQAPMIRKRMSPLSSSNEIIPAAMHYLSKPAAAVSTGDLNNVSAMRPTEPPRRDPAFAYRSLGISAEEDDPEVRAQYRPFLLSEDIQQRDWVSQLELATITKLAFETLQTDSRLRILILYGSLRQRYEQESIVIL